jgi:hypothetical protein
VIDNGSLLGSVSFARSAEAGIERGTLSRDETTIVAITGGGGKR